MPLMFQWDPAWETGNAAIDRQHKALLQQLERLMVALSEGREALEVERALLLLGDYIDYHFSAEEALMEEAGYPDLPDHRANHDEMRLQVQALVEAYHHSAQSIPVVVMEFLLGWLKGHFTNEDGRMAAYLRQHTQRAP